MATVTRYVNTASSGGDGTTNATSGATAAYASLAAWNTAQATDLVAAGDSHVVICTGGQEERGATDVNLALWTCGASNTLTIKSNDARTATSTTTGYYLSSTGTTDAILRDPPSYTTIENIHFSLTNTSGTAYAIRHIGVRTNVVVRNCRFKKTGNGFANQLNFGSSSDGSSLTAINCIFEATTTTATNGLAGVANNNSTGSTFNLYNCTFRGFKNSDATARAAANNGAGQTIIAKNCVFFDNDTDVVAGGGTMTVTYSASDDTISGTGNIDWTAEATDWAAAFTDYANGDYSVKDSSSSLYNAGTDLTASGVTEDYLGTARPQSTAYDIGAFELEVATGSTLAPTLLAPRQFTAFGSASQRFT